METKKIKKAIDISAPKEKVWNVLVDDKHTREWYAAFSEGSHAATDWQVNSKVLFTDNTKSGLIGKVVTNKPYETLSVEYQGIVTDGVEDYDGEIAKAVKGGHETYNLSGESNTTKLSIECDMSKDLYEPMSALWDKALQKVKELAEN